MAVVTLAINGKKYEVNNKISATTSLNVFIREHANLRGTKSMCHEGGCGACIVSVRSKHPVTEKMTNYAVNSCLVPILSCHGWEITTVEGLGDKKKGYSSVQKRLAQFNGTQCGYCSPGMVMNMASLLENKENLTMKEVENSFGGNICRCTGYRPILDAFKSLCSDADPQLLQKVQDIEELDKIKTCPKTGNACSGSCLEELPKELSLNVKDSAWHKVDSFSSVFNIFNSIGDASYMLVAGNTARGVYRPQSPPEVYIDVSSVAELKSVQIDSSIVLGGGVTLTEAMDQLTLAAEKEQFAYAKELVHHIDLIANVPVRNTGTLAGNLSIKHKNREFPSDIFICLETVGAKILIVDSSGERISVSPSAYLDLDMNKKIIVSITLPPLTGKYALKTYKIMPRAQNAHAYVNAGFYIKFTNGATNIVEQATVVFGGINPEFIHASNTERSLLGMDLFDSVVLKSTLSTLNQELHPDWVIPDASPEYRKNLALALFYKFVLHSCPPELLPANIKSGADILDREVSSGQQSYDTNQNNWPLNQPVAKVEGVAQSSGEAQYVNDLHTIPGELFAAFVQATRPLTNITNIDPSEALALPGVEGFFTARDIPGANNFASSKLMQGYYMFPEEVFVTKKVLYNGQPLGVIVAESQHLALKAAKLVKVEYEETGGIPMFSVRDILAKRVEERVEKLTEIKPKDIGTDVVHVLNGSMDMGGQYHYTMETQTCVCVPIEDGLDVYPSSQWLDSIHISIAEALDIPQSKINVNIRRLGGGYGGKGSRPAMIAIACAVAAYRLNRPVRFVMSLEDNMEVLGKRYGCYNDYEVGVNAEGRIQYLKNDFYQDFGSSLNENQVAHTTFMFKNCYEDNAWEYRGHSVITDTASNHACRAPGTTEGIAMIECIMDHIAFKIGADPLAVRVVNMANEDDDRLLMIQEFKESIDYEARKSKVEDFNASNRWRKRGIAMVPMRYPVGYFGNFMGMVSIYHGDGTVAVTHGGIEMGQGINTKVAQVCAHELGISIDNVSVKPSNTMTAPNAMVTGGSVGSELCCYATIRACETLLKRLEPIKEKMDNPSWADLIAKAHQENVNLSASHMFSPEDNLKGYIIFGLSAAEIEVDLLTGNIQLLRVDILEDTGESLNPEIDVGQVEGAFVMGLGYWLTEQIIFDKDSGALLTNRTWTYKPPGAKDIPVDFRIQFKRNSPNPCGVLRSKATGEPAFCMSVVAICAIRHALQSARSDADPDNEDWCSLGAPTTVEDIFLKALNNYKQYTL